MRRTAVFITCITLGTGCTEKWLLPGSITDGGRDATMEAMGSGSRAGGLGTGGVPATGGRGGGPGTGGIGLPPCGNMRRIDFEKITKDLLFSVGRNASMATPFGSGTRMSVVQQAVRAAVMARQNAVNFGYQDFPSALSCPNASACCANSQYVWPSRQTFAAIESATRQCDGQPQMSGCVSLSESRPIADALRNTNTATPPRAPIFGPYMMVDRELILIVDGAPGCTSEDPTAACDTAVMQVSQLKKAHINTYVVPVGEEAESSDCLRRMALQAGTGTASVPFAYPARDSSQLTQSLNQIVNRAAAASCVINVLSPVPADNRQVELNFQNRPIPYDGSGQDGWNWVAGSQGKIEIHGNWCDRLQQNPDDLEIWNVCPVP